MEELVDGGLDDVCLTPLSTHPQCTYGRNFVLTYTYFYKQLIILLWSRFRHVNMLEVPRAVGHDTVCSHTLHHKRYALIMYYVHVFIYGSLGSIKIVFTIDVFESDESTVIFLLLLNIRVRYTLFLFGSLLKL